MAEEDFANVLFRTSTKVFVDDPNAYLKDFLVTNVGDPDIIASIRRAFDDPRAHRVGEQSAMGEAWDVGDYIVKAANICPADISSRPQMLQEMCKKAKLGDIIIRVPSSHDKKEILLAPGYITESLVGILLSSAKIKKHTPAFPTTMGFQYDPHSDSKQVFTVMEKLVPIKDRMGTIPDIMYTYFSIAAGLNTAQKLHKYTHYDLHGGNFMSRPKDPTIAAVYQLPNGKYMYTMFTYEPVIIDFGFNRMETEDVIITPNVQFRSREKPDMMNFYGFNPYYDMFTILHHPLWAGRDQDHTPGEYAIELGTDDRNLGEDLKYVALLLMTEFLNIEYDAGVLKSHLDWILFHKSFWRPDPSHLGTYDEEEGSVQPCTPLEFMSKIATIMEAKQGVFKSEKDIVAALYAGGMVVLDQLVDLSTAEGVSQMKVYNLPKQKMDTTFYPTKTIVDSSPDRNRSFKHISISSHLGGPIANESGDVVVETILQPYNRTVHPNARNTNHLSDQYVHVAVIDQRDAVSAGYTWEFNCCRVDIRNYMRDTKIKSGIAINGSFFQINGDFGPIGVYKTPDMTSDGPIPSFYKNDYGVIGIDRSGSLQIQKGVASTTVASFKSALSSGPILVWDGEIVMTAAKMEEVEDDVLKWQCSVASASTASNKYLSNPGGGAKIPNCGRIEPGELSHAGNPNPRSAVAIDADGRVFFVYVEGRELRGDGMDLNQLAQYCTNVLGAVRAINLDGGGSSQMVWRAPGDTVINQVNPDHDFGYPVGSIISLVAR